MNWYKKAGLLEDIERFGPGGQDWINPSEETEEYRKTHDLYLKNIMGDYYRRKQFIENYGWSVPTKEAIEKLKSFIGGEQVLEVGSGLGLWAKLMRDIGINIIATEMEPDSSKNNYIGERVPHTEIERINGMEAISKYGNSGVLFISWPPYDNPLANDIVKSFKGNKIIFVGEGSGGCTGDDSFFCTIQNQWQEAGSVQIPRWTGIYDKIVLFVRK